MKKNFRKVLAGIFIACLFTLPAFAAQTGDISGTATDTTGAVIVGAKVTIKSLSNGMIWQTTTNGEGQFSVPQVEIGNYEVSIEKNNFKIYKGTTLVKAVKIRESPQNWTLEQLIR